MSTTEIATNTIAERKEVEDLVLRLGRLLDDQDWDGLAAIFDDHVHTDYTSLFGGEPGDVTSADLLAGWRRDLTSLDYAQHVIIGPLAEVDGDRANVTANVQIFAKRADSFGSSLWNCGGRYEIVARRAGGRWLITSFTLRAFWTDGNINVLMHAVTK
jgi:3-phenylpropionate/cinnamic acid dioxygenase small subunit